MDGSSSTCRCSPRTVAPSAQLANTATSPRAGVRGRTSAAAVWARSPSRRRSAHTASGGPGGPPPPTWRVTVSALQIRKPDGGVQRVHSASTRSRTSVNRASRPDTPEYANLQGFSARPSESVNARETRTFPW